MSDKVDVRAKKIIRYRKTHHTMMKEPTSQEDGNSLCARAQQQGRKYATRGLQN